MTDHGGVSAGPGSLESPNGDRESPHDLRAPRVDRAIHDRRSSWLPSWPLIATRQRELRKRLGLMVVVFLFTIGLPFLVLGLRLLLHAFDPNSHGPAGNPGTFQGLCLSMSEFGFIIAATLGATAGTTDITAGVFRHLVITGRSRLALYFARIPAGLSIVLPLVGVAFAALCLVTCFAGISQPTSLNANGVAVPFHLDEAQLKSWLLTHPSDAEHAYGNGAAIVSPHGAQRIVPQRPGAVDTMIEKNISLIYASYVSDETTELNPAINEMAKVGLWLELEVSVGFLVALGLGSLIGQRTVSTILMIVLEIIVTPILAGTVIPSFINGERLIVGVALDQLRPVYLASGVGGGPFEASGLGIPPMPTWAMVTVIVGWIVAWTAVGAWRMMTRDA